jgi:CRISPR-associated protein Cst2
MSTDLHTTGSPVWEVLVAARVELALHSLNNEGNVGNSIRAREVTLPANRQGARVSIRDAISGDMLKHIHARHLHRIAALHSPAELPLCEACINLHPERAARLRPRSKKSGDQHARFLHESIGRCVLCDIHGFMPPGMLGRRSTLNFAWAVSLTDLCTQHHTHARHEISAAARADSSEAPEKKPHEEAGYEPYEADEENEDAEEETQDTQQVFTRPTRSGQYAVACLFETWRVGIEHNLKDSGPLAVCIPEDARKRRAAAALQALRDTLLSPRGAMMATRMPHMGSIEGVLLASHGPALPILSPLDDGYLDAAARLAENIGGIEVFPFSSRQEAARQFAVVIDAIMRGGVGKPRGDMVHHPPRGDRTGAAQAPTDDA